MIFLRLTPWFANQLYEYMAGYALAAELRQELVLDISECVNSTEPYLLDMLRIPPHRKVVYPMPQGHAQHTDIQSIAPQLRERCRVVSDIRLTAGDFVSYERLGDNVDAENIYMCGYFFTRKYYDKYWDDIVNMCRFKVETQECQAFREVVSARGGGERAVGIHMRRGDFLVSTWSASMAPDSFWRAAVAWFRGQFPGLTFYVFSDDYAYAVNTLGNAADIVYVHYGKSRTAAMSEFFCLSMCKHKILSNSSTFSELADQLNEQQGRIILRWGGDWSRYSVTSRLRKRMEQDRLGRWLLARTGRTAGKIELNRRNLARYERKFAYRPFELDNETDEGSPLGRFYELADGGRIAEALDWAYSIYFDYRSDAVFRSRLTQLLETAGQGEEAAIERIVPDQRIHFVLVPSGKNNVSSRQRGLVLLGIVLAHMGHYVSLVLEPEDPSEAIYIQHGRRLIDRRGIALGCDQYTVDEAGEKGIKRLDMPTVVINKKPAVSITLEDKKIVGKATRWSVYYADYDYLDERDAESDEIRWIEGDYLLDQQQRLSVYHIRMAKRLLADLQLLD